MAFNIIGPRPWFVAKVTDVELPEGTDGLEEGSVYDMLQALATRVQALEDAAE